MARRVTFVNTNQVKPAIAPIAFDYLSGPMERAGFELDLLDLCFTDDCDAVIAAHCRTHAPDYWGVTLRNTDDVYFSSGYSFLDKIRDIVSALRRARSVPVVMGGAGFSVMPEKLLAYLGAEVCKLEPPGGDPMRTFPDLFRDVAGHKDSLVVDLRTDAGRELAGEDPFTQLEVFLFGEGFARLTREPGDQPR